MGEPTEGELDTHEAIVEETAEGIRRVTQSMYVVRQAAADLAELARAQGETLDNIEANMSQATERTQGASEQLTIASRSHQRGTKCICWLLLIAFMISAIVVIRLLTG